MKHKILFVSLLAFVSLFFISCAKEYSCEGCGGVLITGAATFSLSGSGTGGGTGGGSSCSGALVSGDFTVGTAATTANTVSLNVVVDSAGSYSVLTNSVNGVSFAASGFFTGTGSQTIILRASGTPLAAGNFNYTAGTGGAAGCGFTITVVPVVDTNYTYFYQASINGVAYKETVTTTNGYAAGNSSMEVSPDDKVVSASVLPIAYPPMPAGKTGMAVSKGILYNVTTINNTQFKTFFNLGNYFYTSDPTINDGVNVVWYDSDGTEWSTRNAPADQTGSTMEIINVADVMPAPAVYSVAITFSFNCKLYDAAGNVRTLTNGIFKGEFAKP